MNFEILALHDSKLVKKKKNKQKIKLNAIYQTSANLLFTKMISPTMCLRGKKLLNLGTLMKYFEDLTQEIKSFLPSKIHHPKL